MYMELSYAEEAAKYKRLVRILEQNGIKEDRNVLCFGSLGSVSKDVRTSFKRLGLSQEEVKAMMK